MDTRIYACRHCDSSVSFHTCGKVNNELIPNTKESDPERHVPVTTIRGNVLEVRVGHTDHQMYPGHYISWIYLETDKTGQSVTLEPGDEPRAVFYLRNERPKAAYAYCSQHGLWMEKICSENDLAKLLRVIDIYEETGQILLSED